MHDDVANQIAINESLPSGICYVQNKDFKKTNNCFPACNPGGFWTHSQQTQEKRTAVSSGSNCSGQPS